MNKNAAKPNKSFLFIISLRQEGKTVLKVNTFNPLQCYRVRGK